MAQLLDPNGWILCPGASIDITQSCPEASAGCGNAPVHAHMYDAGYKKQVCLDTSAVVIEQNMKLNSANRPEMVAHTHSSTMNACIELLV